MVRLGDLPIPSAVAIHLAATDDQAVTLGRRVRQRGISVIEVRPDVPVEGSAQVVVIAAGLSPDTVTTIMRGGGPHTRWIGVGQVSGDHAYDAVAPDESTLIRLVEESAALQLQCGTADLLRGRVHRGDTTIGLSSAETHLLGYLSARPGEIVSRAELLTRAWGYREGVASRTVDTTMKRLRRKVEVDPKNPDHLLTVRGKGYRFVPTSSSARGSAPPVGAGRLVGRTALLERARAWQHSGEALLGIHGPAGAGKTALAAAAFGGDPQAVWLDLTGAHEAAEISARAIEAIGLRRPSRLGPQPVRVAIAGRGPTMLLIVGADDALEVLQDQIPQWLAPGTRVVLTSRRPTRLGATRLTLEPLPLPGPVPRRDDDGALQLFCTLFERHTGAQPDLPDAATIVEAVGGLPGVLALAARRAATLGTGWLADQARQGDRQFVWNDADAQLKAALNDAWEGLAKTARDGLVRLCAIRGPVDLTTAEDLFGAGIVEAIADAADAQLLTVRATAEGPTYRVGPLTMSFLASHTGATDALTEAEALLHRRLAEIARSMVGSGPGTLHRWVQRQGRWLGDLGCHARQAGTVEVYWLALMWARCRGDVQGAQHLATDLPIDPTGPCRADVELVRAWAERSLGELGASRQRLTAFMEQDLAQDNPLRLALAHAELAAIAWSTGDLVACRHHFDTGKIHAAESRDDVLEASFVAHKGLIHYATGRWNEAAKAFAHALALHAAAGEVAPTAMLWLTLAMVRLQQGDTVAALRANDRAVAQSLPPWGMGLVAQVRGQACWLDGDLEAAAGHFEEMVEVFAAAGRHAGQGHAYSALADLAVLRGDIEQALSYARSSVAVMRNGSSRRMGLPLAVLGEVLTHAGDVLVGQHTLTQGLERLRDGGHPHELAEALCRTARAALAKDDGSTAARLVGEAQTVLDQAQGAPGAFVVRMLTEVRERIDGARHPEDP